MSDTLKPCPFCGGNGVIVEDRVLGPNEPLYSPMCEQLAYWYEHRFDPGHKGRPKCEGAAGTSFTTREQAITAWNRRVADTPRAGEE